MKPFHHTAVTLGQNHVLISKLESIVFLPKIKVGSASLKETKRPSITNCPREDVLCGDWGDAY